MSFSVFLDEIIWPDGEDALPADAQDLITRLLKQSPLERLGTGANQTFFLPINTKMKLFKYKELFKHCWRFNLEKLCVL